MRPIKRYCPSTYATGESGSLISTLWSRQVDDYPPLTKLSCRQVFMCRKNSKQSSYLNLLLEILDVVDSQIQHIRSVGLLQETEVQVVDESTLEWSSQRKFALFYCLLGRDDWVQVAVRARIVPCPCWARVLAAS
jgi:hypothetical protein